MNRAWPALGLMALVGAIWAMTGAFDEPGALRAQAGPTNEDLVAASLGHTIAIGSLTGERDVTHMPLELYVARVLAGEGEPNAADAARQALAVAIRTYAIVQLGTHRREGFDLCDTVHCQVFRAADDTSRRAALATAGRVLTVDGVPARLFYSASCGGRSEAAARVWPGATFPYMQVVRDDDVHEEDEPWTLELTLEALTATLGRAGFGGRTLRDVVIDGYTDSGRVERLRLPGLRPDAIAGTAFREALGTTRLRSTAFSITRDGDLIRFTGRGYGHGVGMCVVGAGRRARRGESVEAILAQYYPNLTLSDLGRTSMRSAADMVSAARRLRGIDVRVPAGSTLSASALEKLAQTAYASLARALGTSATPIVVELHDSLDTFHLEVRKPWWTSANVTGMTIDLAPSAVLEQRDGIELTLRRAMAELLMASALADRPAWVRAGGASYFARATPPEITTGEVLCPADAELTLALSAAAQRDADARALQCFTRAIARVGDWRRVGGQ